MSERIRQLICDINAAWKPDHFVYGIREEELSEPLNEKHVQAVPYPLRRWRVIVNERIPNIQTRLPLAESATSTFHNRVTLEHTKLMLGANHRRRFYLNINTNALESITTRGMAWGFYACVMHFEMHSRDRVYLPLVTHVPDDMSDDIAAMESFLSDLLEELKVPTYEVSS